MGGRDPENQLADSLAIGHIHDGLLSLPTLIQ